MAEIVVVEDDLHILRVVSLWLRNHQHTVHEADDGRRGLELVHQIRPDVLIADVNMPVMDGIELVFACAAEGLPKLGSIILTSRCDQEEIRERLNGVNVVFHPKPFSPSRLVREVQSLIGSSRSETSDERGPEERIVNDFSR